MHITFVARGWENLGISQLSAIIKLYGHQVSLGYSPGLFNDSNHLVIPGLSHLFEDQDMILRQIEKLNPDVLAISALTGNYHWLSKVAEKAKKANPRIKTIFGGIHPSAVPDYVFSQKFVDFICVGEGDSALPLIIDAIERNDTDTPIPNTYSKTKNGKTLTGPQMGFVQNLDSLPLFDKPLWEEYMNFNDYYITTTSRGCPYQCAFCFNSYYRTLGGETPGKYFRRRSVEHVLYELKVAKKRYRPKQIEFFDDVFTINKDWIKSFLPRYRKEIGIPFQIFTHVNFIDDTIAQWLSEAGCLSAQIGIQSLDEGYKKDYLQRFETNEQAAIAIESLKKHKVHTKLDHMFGLPNEPIKAQEDAKNFYVQHTPYRIQTYWTNYFPRTKILNIAKENQILTETDLEQIYNGESIDSFTRSNKSIDPEKIRAYKQYDCLFKLIPVLPVPLKKKIQVNFLNIFPTFLLTMLSFVLDLLIGIFRFNPDHLQYIKYYCLQTVRHIMQRTGLKPFAMTKIYTNDSFDLNFNQNIK